MRGTKKDLQDKITTQQTNIGNDQAEEVASKCSLIAAIPNGVRVESHEEQEILKNFMPQSDSDLRKIDDLINST